MNKNYFNSKETFVCRKCDTENILEFVYNKEKFFPELINPICSHCGDNLEDQMVDECIAAEESRRER